MDGYTDVFGGENISPAQLDYVHYEIDEDLVLVWPWQQTFERPNVSAHKMDIVALSGNLRVFMPSAKVDTVGQDALIRNMGANTFTVVNFDNVPIVSITPGTQWFIWITNNETDGGVWTASQFSATTSTANAALLAGAGLRANFTKLDQDLVTTSLVSNYTATVADRARVLMHTGGVATYNFDDAATLSNGWFVYVINAGDGTLTLDPFGGQLIDGDANKQLAPNENAIVFCDGLGLHTLGYGRSLVNTVTSTLISVAPGGTTTLTPVQTAAQVQDWSGALTANAILDYSGAVGFWFVWNNTTGAFTSTARVSGTDPGVVVPQGNFSILRSNGSAMEIAFTATSGTVTSVGTTAGELVGGPITGSGIIGLADTAVVPGTYGDPSTATPPSYPILTVDQKGRITLGAEQVLGNAAFIDLINGLIPSINGGSMTGDVKSSIKSSIPGWVLAFGTIGDAASGASNRSNADCHELFLTVWTEIPAAVVYVAGTTTPVARGATAQADWDAHRHIALPDVRGDTIYGRSNMGGVDRGNLSIGFGNATTQVGNQGGAQNTQVRVFGFVDTSGAVTVSVGVNGTMSGGAQDNFVSANTPGTTGGIVTVQSGIVVSGASFGSGSGSFTAAGNIRNDGNNVTGQIQTVAPGIIMNFFIKL